ncbi:MAG: hypothetical protein EXR75_00195 [Myxococcales bacterium]|nr:hypothetical protein [Myxococcales bacterium]
MNREREERREASATPTRTPEKALVEAIALTEAMLASGVTAESVELLLEQREPLLAYAPETAQTDWSANPAELANKLRELDARLARAMLGPHLEEFAWLRGRIADIELSFPELAAIATRVANDGSRAPSPDAPTTPVWTARVRGVAARYRRVRAAR